MSLTHAGVPAGATLGDAQVAGACAPGLFEQFARAAAARPDEVAVGGRDEMLSFAELESRVRRMATCLRARGIGVECHVGIHLPRDADVVVAILAVLQLGAAYVPLDPAQPDARLAHMVGLARPLLVVTRTALHRAALADVSRFDMDTEPWRDVEPLASAIEIDGAHPAYTIFTSGSTGVPKGVQVSHRAVAWLLESLEHAGVVRARPARVGWNASIGFDASVQQWMRICRGDSLFLVNEETRRDPQEFVAFAHRYRLDDLDLTPSHAQVLIDELERRPVSGLRLIVGGEAISAPLWDRLRRLERLGIDAVNVYGPTEATVDALQAPLRDFAAPTLGHPLPGVHVRLLDARLRAVSPGETGQLCLGGPGLARGYVGRSGLTASRFIPEPDGAFGARLYLTGDLARQAADGSLHFVGRMDRQVKIRGHRIELEEVEAVLLGHADVRAVGVAAAPDGASLCAFLVLERPGALAAVQAHAAAALPDPMRPARYATLDQLPLTPSGKLDRARLAALVPAQAGGGGERREVLGEAAVPDCLEDQIASIWCEVLRLPAVAAGGDFFQLGGNSLAAMQVSSRLQSRYRRRIPTRQLFENPTLAAYAEAVSVCLKGR